MSSSIQLDPNTLRALADLAERRARETLNNEFSGNYNRPHLSHAIDAILSREANLYFDLTMAAYNLANYLDEIGYKYSEYSGEASFPEKASEQKYDGWVIYSSGDRYPAQILEENFDNRNMVLVEMFKSELNSAHLIFDSKTGKHYANSNIRFERKAK